MAHDLQPGSHLNTLTVRAAIIRDIRRFFTDREYLEVETPLRIPAPAPECHIDALSSGSWFLHTSPELCMKRLLARGFPRIFQICHCWRDGERGSMHLPEFTMLEWYSSGFDYGDIMTQCEELFRFIARATIRNDRIIFRGREVNFTGPWERLTVREAFQRFAPITMEQALGEDLFDDIMVTTIEPRLGMTTPTFICDYPAERAALARLHQSDPSVAERFELYIGGLELANAFTELTDVEEQRRRFQHEESYRRSQGKPAYPVPEKFLAELPAMPPSAGIALGIDRLVMVFTDAATIDEVVAFTPEKL